MVLFIGASFQDDVVEAVAMDRKARPIASVEVPVPGMTRVESPDPDAGEIWEVPVAEWTRAGCLALQDLFFQVPVKLRRLWGIALAGPQGWVAIDPDFDPVSPLRLTPGRSPLADFRRWLEENPKRQRHILAVFSPKDYFRFRISGGFAADVTQASRLGLLCEDERAWDMERLDELELLDDWFPPPFDSSATTGRISQEGVDMTSIPGGAWIVAGADSVASRELASADVRRGELFVYLHRSAALAELSVTVAPGHARAELPPHWERLYSPLTDWRTLRRSVRVDAVDPAASLRAAVSGTLDELRRADIAPGAIVLDCSKSTPEWFESFVAGCVPSARLGRFAGRSSPGVAYLAGLSKRIFHDVDTLYRKADDAWTELRAIDNETGDDDLPAPGDEEPVDE